MTCSIARTLDVIGEWWTPLVLREVSFGRRRFEEIQSDLGIARNILADRLATLVDHEILERHPYTERPVRYEYHLTQRGEDLFPVLMSLMAWGDRWLAEEGKPFVVRHTECGHECEPVMTCSACGGRLERETTRARRGPGWRPPSPVPGEGGGETVGDGDDERNDEGDDDTPHAPPSPVASGR